MQSYDYLTLHQRSKQANIVIAYDIVNALLNLSPALLTIESENYIIDEQYIDVYDNAKANEERIMETLYKYQALQRSYGCEGQNRKAPELEFFLYGRTK